MHAADAFFVVDYQLAAFIAHAVRGAKIDNFFYDVEFSPITAGMCACVRRNFSADIGLYRFMVDADVVSPCPDYGHVGTGNGGHAAVGACIKFELELVRECRAVKLFLICLGHIIAAFLRVIACKLAAGLSEAGCGSSQV